MSPAKAHNYLNLQTQVWQPDVVFLHNNLCLLGNLEIRGMTLGQGHDTPLGYTEHLCKV